MIRLDTTTRKLQALLNGAVTTTQPDVVVCWSDKTSSAYSGGTTVIAMNGATAVDICPAPAASTKRDIDYVSIRNNDTVSAVVTVRLNDNGTLYKIITATLATGEKLEFTHAGGWQKLDVYGQTGAIGPAGPVGPTGSTGPQGPINAAGNQYLHDFFKGA